MAVRVASATEDHTEWSWVSCAIKSKVLELGEERVLALLHGG